MTECMPITSPPQDYDLDREGCSGISVGPELGIADDKGNLLPPNMEGNIVVRGCPSFLGYENNDEGLCLENGMF